MPERVIVDDTDPSITYTGNWTLESAYNTESKEYNGTIHKTVTPGSSLSFRFHGSRLTIFGTLLQPMTGGPTSSLTIDSASPYIFNSTGNVKPRLNSSVWSHAELYTILNLAHTNHTATLKVGNVSETHPFYFDFYTALTGQYYAPVIIDDSNPRVLYGGNWEKTGVKEEYLGTAHESPANPGGTATLRFNGTSIQVYGAVNITQRPSLNFTIDSSPPTTFTTFPSNTYGRHTLIYESKGLSPTEHELVVKNIDTTRAWLDYFIYDMDGMTDAEVGSINGPQVADKPPVAAIVAGVLGGVALLLLFVALVYFQRRRRRRIAEETNALSTEPFVEASSGTPLTSFQTLSTKGKKTKGQRARPTEPSILSPVSPTSEGDGSMVQSEWPSQSSGSDSRSVAPLVPVHQRKGQGTISRNPRESGQTGAEYLSPRPRRPTANDTPWDHPTSPPPAYHDSR